jgi:glycosyltransferase involved in cell wall biosynthesis
MKITFIVWARYHRRSELIAQHFGATIHYICWGQGGKLFQTPVRYLVQAWQTWHILRREGPDVIFVQNPPIFAVLVVSVYSQCYGVRYIIDSHTGAFIGPKWSWSVGLHRLLSHRALTTLVHNKSQEKIVKDWDSHHMVVAFTPGDYPLGENFPLLGDFNVAVIGSILEDEPLDVVFEAASRMPDVLFYVTGNSERINARALAKKPANCYLTGYISYEKYVGLLRGVNLVMTLTTRDHTLLMGSFEAISLEKPLIVSNWPVLQDYFPQGTVFVSNTVESICEGVSNVRRNQITLQQEMSLLNKRLVGTWNSQFKEIQGLIYSGTLEI